VRPVSENRIEGLDAFRVGVREWAQRFLDEHGDDHQQGLTFDDRAASQRVLQRAAFDAGWLRYGWPTEFGGYGGDARHRAALYDEFGAVGLVFRGPAEHIEIMAAPILKHWSGLDATKFTAFLRGDEWWCQGFSEPDAGSDLIALQTQARRDGDVYRLSGRKIWTSWAGNARHCLVLARTGTVEDRHHGLSTLFVDLDLPGVHVRRITQANGSDELAEVTFDDVVVPLYCLVGEDGGGFAVALDVIGCERSSFAWLRQSVLYNRADQIACCASTISDAQLGELAIDLFALRSATAEQVERLADGNFPGPEAAVVKVLLIRAEQQLYDAAYEEFGSELALGPGAEMARWQEEYSFSRAVSIYGGTLQVQLSTVARFVLGISEGVRS
jgi:alkylation response protein AidB-like acyl-CoA dehydrogenase